MVKVTEISKKRHESRLQWYSHVMRRDKNYVGKRVMVLEVEQTRGIGRPKGDGWTVRRMICERKAW